MIEQDFIKCGVTPYTECCVAHNTEKYGTVLQEEHTAKSTVFCIRIVARKSTKFDLSWNWATKDLRISRQCSWGFKTAGI
jgi:valyl-tRNA synthetase